MARSLAHKVIGYAFPVGEGDVREAINEIIDDSKRNNIPFVFYNATEKNVEFLKEEYPDMFHITYQRDSSDYIYRVDDLANLPGKKYHGKRNHIAFFEKNHDWQYEPITEYNINECLRMNDDWGVNNSDRHLKHIGREKVAIERAFNSFFELGLKGGLIRAEGKVVAYTVGEPINDKVFCVHLEKAFSEIRGSYPMINREFVRHEMQGYEYVNREEDLNLEGLRKAKLSYHPVFLCDKYAAVSVF